ncbi:prolyl oligopeptidase family serine peptidase [uncultured Psychroserpens sp.]|uniref:prolyl oligopeptidase family serine peptidase n=1 Tax=uncultured Psychroserpens sp. TaxID=255436 RepID=UPI0026205968|nr:prolyl oligopeptidase family serine peptidase [uncultured Psychroserpens sp.]
MKNIFNIILITLVFFLTGCQKGKFNYNVITTKKTGFKYDKFDKTIEDTYQWLEQVDSSQVKSWAKQQDSLTKSYIGNMSETKNWIEKRMAELAKDINNDTPIVTNNGSHFFIENDYQKSQPLLKYKHKESSKEITLIDPNSLSTDGNIVLNDFIPSPSGKYLAYSLSKNSSRYRDWNIMNVSDQTELVETINAAYLNIQSWLPNDEGFIYRTFVNVDRDDESFIPNTSVIKKHIIGNEQDEDVTLYTAKKDETISAHLDSEGRNILITEGTNTTTIWLKSLEKNTKPLLLLDGKTNNVLYSFIDNIGSKYWFLSYENAPNGKVIEVEVLNNSVNSINEIIPSFTEAINQAFVFGNHFVLHTLNKAKPLLKVYDLNGNYRNQVELPVGLTWNSFTPAFQQGISGNKNSSWVYIRSQGLTASNSVYRYNIDSDTFETYIKSKTPFNIDNYETKQVFYKSEDGTEVPMFITHKKGLKLDGNNPTLLYVYGAYGWTALPFITRKYALFLEQGGIHAMPNIRGGGALGADWYKDGRGMNKKNGIDDCVNAAKWLIDNKYTSSEKLIIEGNSAGGIVAAAAVNKAPELFKVAWLEFPVFDLARVMQFRGGNRWKSQFGNPDVEEEFNYMYSYSPYHNIKPESEYPYTLIAAGEKDPIASPLHSYKMTAKLQEYSKAPSLLYINWDGGHGGKNEEERTALRVAELTFAFEALGIKPKSIN